MKFREHRGDLEASMSTTVELDGTREALLRHVESIMPAGVNVMDGLLRVKFYSARPQADWTSTYIVSLVGYGVVGFTDGAVDTHTHMRYPNGKPLRSVEEFMELRERSYTLQIDEGQRQMLLMALSRLGIDRPGFDEALWEFASQVDEPDRKLSMYERFQAVEKGVRAANVPQR